MAFTLYIIDFISWTTCYALIVGKSFRDRTYGMPVIPLGINLAWEINRLSRNMWQINGFFYFLWVTLDLVILVTFYLYAFRYAELPKHKNEIKEVRKKQTKLYIGATAYFLLMFITVSVLMEYIPESSQYIAFADNLLMSILFIRMLVKRGCVRGQSVLIGFFKLIGTLTAAIATYIDLSDILYLIFGIIIAVLDIAYIIMLFYYKKHTSFQVKKRGGIRF